MVAVGKPAYTTPEEYLFWERKAPNKHEYHNGIVVAMAGATRAHTLITGNLTRHLGNRLDTSPCETYSTDMRVRVPECNKYYYPDLAIVCEPPQFADAELDTLLNPVVIIEVLSQSTEKKDRGEKFDCYWTLDSLRAYLLVSQYAPSVELFSRQENGWFYDKAVGLSAVLKVEALNVTLPLADIYARVEFPPAEEEESAPPA